MQLFATHLLHPSRSGEAWVASKSYRNSPCYWQGASHTSRTPISGAAPTQSLIKAPSLDAARKRLTRVLRSMQKDLGKTTKSLRGLGARPQHHFTQAHAMIMSESRREEEPPSGSAKIQEGRGRTPTGQREGPRQEDRERGGGGEDGGSARVVQASRRLSRESVQPV